MRSKKLLLVGFFLLGILIYQNYSYGQEKSSLLTIGYQSAGKIDTKAFQLKSEATLKIEGHGGLYKKIGNDLLFYGWILDSKSRKVVWNLIEDANDQFFAKSDPGRFTFKKEVKLPAGQYEVYYAAGMNYNRFGNNYNDISISDLGDLLNLIFSEARSNENDRYVDAKASKFSMTISGPTDVLVETAWDQKVNEFSKNALISIIRAGNNQYIKKSFTVADALKLNILEIGEQTGTEMVDFAWIVNANTYEKVWPNKETKFKKAGGGSKNKTVFQTINLPKGNYTLFYITDDSHSYDKWNVLPPYDPQFWGITIWPDEADKSKAKLIDLVDPFVLSLTKARDNDYLSKGFTLKKEMKIRVISEGESSGDFDMADYGWIVNTDTHKTVWEFTQRKSQYAGGAEKNKIINEEITLPQGNYIAYYATDDSHSYNDWNSAPPLIPELWGISILVDSNKDSFVLTDSQTSPNKQVVAEIVKVRDDERLNKDFTLSKESKVRIYAIGEGQDDELVDYGWIKNRATGKVVWEMTYRTTENAGGAEKNRMFDGIVLLPAGDYTLYYETDDSHSFRDWNDAPPFDQDHYGITVSLIE